MFARAFDFLVGTIPPEHRPSVRNFALTFVIGGHILWACGWIPFIEGEGFAMATETRQIKTDVQTLRVEILEAQIFEQRLRHCSTPDGATRTLHLQRLQRLRTTYWNLTRSEYPLPSCEDIA